MGLKTRAQNWQVRSDFESDRVLHKNWSDSYSDTWTGWVNRKIGDLLGTDNQAQGFADFIIGEVFAHCKASQLLDSIVDVLDEDAEPLVLQLYKVGENMYGTLTIYRMWVTHLSLMQLIIYQTEELASKGCWIDEKLEMLVI